MGIHGNPGPAAALAGLASMLGGCTVTVHEHTGFVTDHGIVREADAVRDAELRVTPKMRTVTVSLESESDGGTACWTLRSPDGDVAWSCTSAGAGRVASRMQLPATPGRWRFRREWQGWSGSQELSIVATGGGKATVTVTAGDEAH